MQAKSERCIVRADRSTLWTEPVASFSFPITSMVPKPCLMAAMSAARRGSVPGRVTRWLAVPNVAAFGDDGVLVATAAPRIVAETATASSASTSNCWRHSRRNSRHAQRTTAWRAGTPPCPAPTSAGRWRGRTRSLALPRREEGLGARWRRGLVGHSPVAQDHHAGHTLPAGDAHQAHHRLRVDRVEGTRRLVRQQQTTIPRDPVELERQSDVLGRGEPGQQVEILEHVADRAAPQARPLVPGHPRQRDATDQHLAVGRVLQAPGDGQQGALARAAGPHHSHQLPGIHRQVDAAQRLHLGRTLAVDLRHPPQLEHAHRRTPTLRRSLGNEAGAGPGGSAAARLRRPSAASSQRMTESSRNSSASTTSARPRSNWASSSSKCVHCCISSTRYRRCTWITSCTSIPGTRSATSTLITSSSRGGDLRSGGVRNHPTSSCSPSAVIRKPFCGPSSPLSSDWTNPSRSSRWSVVYTWPTFSGHTSPVLASNSSRSRRPYLGPSLNSASNACRILTNSTSQYHTEYTTKDTRRWQPQICAPAPRACPGRLGR